MIKGKIHISFLMACLAVALWSTVATAFKLGLRHYSPYELLLFSSFFSLLFLFLLLFLTDRKAIINGINSKEFVLRTLLQGILNPFLYYLVLFAAYDKLPAQIVQPINFTWPIFLSISTILFLKEKFRPLTIVALFLSFSGVVILSYKQLFTQSFSSPS